MKLLINRWPVPTARLIRIEGDSNYSRLYFAGGKQVLMAITLARYEQLLPDFVRVHKSHLINPDYATGLVWQGRGLYFIAMDQALIPVSRHRLSGAFAWQKPTLSQMLAHFQGVAG